MTNRPIKTTEKVNKESLIHRKRFIRALSLNSVIAIQARYSDAVHWMAGIAKNNKNQSPTTKAVHNAKYKWLRGSFIPALCLLDSECPIQYKYSVIGFLLFGSGSSISIDNQEVLRVYKKRLRYSLHSISYIIAKYAPWSATDNGEVRTYSRDCGSAPAVHDGVQWWPPARKGRVRKMAEPKGTNGAGNGIEMEPVSCLHHYPSGALQPSFAGL